MAGLGNGPLGSRLLGYGYLAMDYVIALDLVEPYVGAGPIKTAFWRTLTADVVVSPTRGKKIWYKRSLEHDTQSFWTWWVALLGGALEKGLDPR